MPDSPWALIYLRKSRDKAELADPDLLHKHRRELLRLAAARGHQVPPELIFEERGSGDTLRARPECRRMLERVAQRPRNAGGYLWTTEVSRLTRGVLSDRAQIYETLIRPGIIHCTRDRDYDLHKASDLYYWETETAQARRELGVYRERVEAARIEMTLEGRIRTGKVPIGWRVDRNARNRDGSRGKPVPDPRWFPVVQAICEEALHLSTYALAAKYGLPHWKVHELLRNPFICGWPAKLCFPHDGERTRADNGAVWVNPSHRLRAHQRDQWLWPKQAGDYEAACTREHWEAIQAALDSRRETRAKTTTADGWCRAVVCFVGHAGRARCSSKAARYLTYELSVRPPERTSIYIPRALVHEAAQARIAAVLRRPDLMRRAVDDYRAAVQHTPVADTVDLQTEAGRLERLLTVLLDRELRAADAGDARELQSVIDLRDRYKRELIEAEARLAALASRGPADPAVDALAHLLEGVDDRTLAALWPELEEEGLLPVLVAGLIEQIRCRVELPPSGSRWRREVEAVVLRELWRGFFD